MKVNTPEKLYLHPTAKGKVGASWLKFPLTNEDIEYVRKDAFIEEVCNFLQENCTYIHPRKGTPTCAVNLTLLKEYLEDKV